MVASIERLVDDDEEEEEEEEEMILPVHTLPDVLFSRFDLSS